MPNFEHLRHLPPTPLAEPRPLVLVCPALRSGVNLSRIVRLAGCCGVTRIITCGNVKLDKEIARDAADFVNVEKRRTLLPILQKLKQDGYQLVGLEQTTESECLYDFTFVKQTAIVFGNERAGLDEETLSVLDRVAEIPVYGPPASHNVATSVTMAVYEYCRQFPKG